MKRTLQITVLLVSYLTTNAQITLENTYENTQSNAIGTFQGLNFREGGFSGLHYIPNTNGTEFWTVTDRGVNIDAVNANANATVSANYPTGCKPTYDKIYPFPTYAPKIMRLKIVGNSLQILETISLKRPNGTTATGLINPTGFGSTATEVASTNIVSDCANFDVNTVAKDVWGIDSEGIDVDAEGNFWICEEGGPSIWKVNRNGVVIKRYTPYELVNPEDTAIDKCFSYRRNNRGFEGITVTPNGKVYAIIQSPIFYKNVAGVAGSGTLNNSRVHRILEIDPATGVQKMYAYVNDGPIGTSSDIRTRDLKIGDIKAINNTTFLVIEQGLRGAQNIKRLYQIDISRATPVLTGLAYSNNTKTLEELETPANLTTNDIIPVEKSLLLDFHNYGIPTTIEKLEGIAIIDANTIMVNNDNDYGQLSPNEDGIAIENNQKSSLFKYSFNGTNALQNFIPNNNAMLTANTSTFKNKDIKLYPNPVKNELTIENVDNNITIDLYSIVGVKVKTEKLIHNKLDVSSLDKGIYFIKLENKTVPFIKE